MTILSPMFLFLFVPILLTMFHVIGRKWGETGALIVIILGSFAFAQTQGGWFLALFSASLLFNMLIIQKLIDGDRKAEAKLLLFAVCVNLLSLVVFKYSGLLSRVPQLGMEFRKLETLIPITISFLTFQRLTALVDAPTNRAELLGWRGALRFTAFAGFFPNLLIGPIAYLQEILPQFRRNDFGSVRAINLAVGLTLVAIGLFKKAFIADQIGAAFVNPVWASLVDHRQITSVDALLAIIGYFVQLYFDFSGYSDVAIGVGRMFGIILPTNFFSPFRAVGIVDFYRRWHIGLTRVISRFLFTPLSIMGTRLAARRGWRGLRRPAVSLWVPLIINFFIIGIWHDAKVTYVLYGLLHGIWYSIESQARGSKWWKSYRKRRSDLFRAVTGRMITLPVLMVTFSLFRAPSVGYYQQLMASLVPGRSSEASVIATSLPMLALLTGAYLIVFFLPNSHEFLGRYRPGILTYKVPSYTPTAFARHWRPTLGWGLLMIVLLGVGFYTLPQAAPFSYGVF